jgi:hypothetical protein
MHYILLSVVVLLVIGIVVYLVMRKHKNEKFCGCVGERTKYHNDRHEQNLLYTTGLQTESTDLELRNVEQAKREGLIKPWLISSSYDAYVLQEEGKPVYRYCP